MVIKRRLILIASAITGTGLVSKIYAQAEVGEKDAQSVALGYVSDATNVDMTKYPRYASGQKCASCSLFQAKSGESMGRCPIFGGKLVRAEGWCSAYAKKA